MTWRVMRRRLVSSPLAAVAGLAFPAFLIWAVVGHSYGTAAKFFFFLLPHVFLFAAQDAVRSDIESGALETVLFIGGRFRGYLGAKLFIIAIAAGAYAAGLFGLFAAWGLAVGGYEPAFALRFALALLAGLYYLALAGALSHFLRAGSNVLVLILAQAAAVFGLLATAASRPGLIDYAASGRFPGPGPKLLFGALTAVLPNVIVSGRISIFTGEIAAGLGLALYAQWRLLRRLEIGK